MTNAGHEFDVAFSFHSKDEGLATQLNDLLQDRFKTFLYSKRQELLAGADGEVVFNAVFEGKARCVVVLYRNEWGETPFTRIEQTAIRNRAYKEGYEFTIFIPTDKPAVAPPWLPKTRLYFGLDRYGLQGAAGVIEKRIQELGGEPRVESLSDRAARLERANALKDAKRRFRESEIGVRAAAEAFGRLTSALRERAAQIAGANPSLAHLKVQKISDFWLICGFRVCAVVTWRTRFCNSLDESELCAAFYDGVPRLPGLVPAYDHAKRLKEVEFDYELLTHEDHGFVERGGERRPLSTDDLADHLLRIFLDAAERYDRQS